MLAVNARARPQCRSANVFLVVCILLLLVASSWARSSPDSSSKEGESWVDGLALWVGGAVSHLLAALHPPTRYPSLRLSNSHAPCDDFYGYVCADWIEQHAPAATHEKQRTTFSELEKQNFGVLAHQLQHPPPSLSSLKVVRNAQQFYSSCMNLDAIDAHDASFATLELLRPVDRWRSGSLTFSEATGQLLRAGVSPLFSAGELSGLSQGQTQNDGTFPWLLPDHEVASQPRHVDALASFAGTVLHAVGGGGGDDEFALRCQQAGQRVAMLERRLWSIRLTRGQERTMALNGTLASQMSSEEISDLTGSWVNTEQLLGATTGASVTVQFPPFFRHLAQVLQQYGNDTVADYLTVGAVKTYAAAMPTKVRTAWTQYISGLGGSADEDSQRRLTCARIVSQLFVSVSDRLFIDAAFNEPTRVAAAALANQVKQAWEKRLSSYSWFDEDSATAALARVQNSIVAIGFDDVVRHDTALEVDSVEASFPVLAGAGGGFLHDYLTCRAAGLAARLSAPINSHKVFSEWVGLANAFCDFSRPGGYAVAIGAGVLREPFFSPNRPPLFNYAALGFLVGHELSHGFDDIGSHFDATGRMRPWMGNATAAEFHRRADEMAALFDGIPVTMDGVSTHVRGRQTLGETIADNGGIRVAWDAFQAAARHDDESPIVNGDAPPDDDATASNYYGLSTDQLFFSAYARSWCSHYTDEYALARTLQNAHPLSSIRVKQTLANFPSFAKAFDCHSGSPYAPRHTVTLWRRH